MYMSSYLCMASQLYFVKAGLQHTEELYSTAETYALHYVISVI